MTDELKPCKLCGPQSDDDHKPLLMSRRDVRNEYDVEYEMFCPLCGLSVHGEYEHEAIDRWNRLNDGPYIAPAKDADHIVDHNKMVAEPAGDLAERVANVLAANMTVLYGRPIERVSQDCARAILALFQPQMEAAEGLLQAASNFNMAISSAWAAGEPEHKLKAAFKAQDELNSEMMKARAAGLGRESHD